MRQRGSGRWIASILSLVALLPFVASAQVRRPEVVFDDAQIFHPATDPSRFVSVYDSRNLDPGQFTLGLYGTYAANPIDLSFEAANRRSSHLVTNTVGADLIAAIGVTNWLELGIDVPAIRNSSEKVLSFGRDTEPGGYFLGDITVEGKFSLIRRPIGHGFGLSVLPRIVAPSGDVERFAGSGKIGGGGLLIADWRYNKINVGLNAGGIFRNSNQVPDQMLMGAGVTVPATRFLDVIGEITGRTSFKGERAAPFEGLFSLRFHRGALAFTIGAGGGITTGRGAPEFRFVGGLTPYIPEKEIPPPRADLITNSRKAWKLAVDVDNDGRTNPGDTLEYTLDVVNSGTASAEEVVFTDMIPEHTTYVPGSMTMNGEAVSDAADADSADFDVTTRGAVTAKVGTVSNEEGKNSVTFAFRVTIDPNIVDLTVVTNEAVVSQKNLIPPGEEEEATPTREERLGPAEVTVFPRVRERETVVVTPEKLEITRNIHFEFNKATIRSESFPILNDVAGVLKDNPQLNIMIEGHTDGVGSVEYNQKLSDRRAESVRNYLIAKGVAGTRLAPKGRGKLAPIASNDTAVGRALNRRVEFLIVNPEAVRGKNIEKRSFVEDITPQSEPVNLEQRIPGGRGMGDRDLGEAQEGLRKIGYLSEQPSGIMTSATKAALERFQRDNGLPVTGAADAITRKALDEAVELQRSR